MRKQIFQIFQHFFGYSPALSKPFTNILKGFLVFCRIILLNIEEVVFKSCSNLLPSCTLVKYVISPSKILFRNSTKVWNLKTKISEVSKIWRRTKSKLIEQDLMESSWTIQWRIELRNVILFLPNSEYEKWIFWTILRGIN